jgi:NADPH2:quinone reductase
MKAIRIHQFGGPDVLRYEDISVSEPGRGEARVKIEVAGLNFIDIYQRTGQYGGNLPIIPGREAAGVVDAVGSGVTVVKPGDRVAYAMQSGSYAEFANVPAWKLVLLPQEVSTQQAAAVMLQGMTAHYLVHSTYPLSNKKTVLVHAAAGGVGRLLVQLAKRQGARVIGTVSTEEKAELSRKVGADEIILYTQTDFEIETRRLTDGRGVDVVYDSVGHTTFDKSLNCLRPRGYMVLHGQSSGPVSPMDPQELNGRGSLFLTRPGLRHYVADHEELLWRATDLFNWMVEDELDIRIDRTLPLSEVAEAHRYMENRKTTGKVLLIP